MKRTIAGIGILLIGMAAATACGSPAVVTVPADPGPRAAAQRGDDADLFFEALAPYGSWIWLEGYGWAWSPYNVAVDWRPYLYGRWAYTDSGWMWVSDEDWGWAVYHYGRWAYDPTYGWVWVPGSVWGPAWVAWTWGDGWAGWAPLPWQVRWRAGVGLDWGGVDVRVVVDPTWWCFVEARHLVEPSVRRHVVPAGRNVTLLRMTRHVTRYTIIESRVVNLGPQVEAVGRAAGRPVPRRRVREADFPEAARSGKPGGAEVVVFRPENAGKDWLHRAAGRPGPDATGAHPREERPDLRDRRHEQESRKLESYHRKERDELERIHGRESETPPAGVSRDEIRRRQDAEHRALESKQERERRVIKERQHRDRGRPAPGRPAATARPGATSKPAAEHPGSSKSARERHGEDRKGGGKTGGGAPAGSEAGNPEPDR